MLWNQGNLTSMRSPNGLVVAAKVNPLEIPVKQDKPKAYRYPLWAHLDEIQRWRLGQETWEAIADKLSHQYGIKISLQGVQAFFKRASNRDRRRPLGLGSKPSSSIEIQPVAS